jgi:alpha-N-arabinofuranosidase
MNEKYFHNPILPGFHPDPSICRAGDDYFLVNSSFAYYPGVPIFHSRDLVHWQQIGHCLNRPSQLPLKHTGPSGGIFAPTIRYHDGVFYMVTTNVTNGGNFFVTAHDPSGEWSDPFWLAQGGIDPSLLFDNGHAYLTGTGVLDDAAPGTKNQGILQSKIDISTGSLLTKPRLIWTGTGGSFPEGPHLYHIGEKYYLMIAEGGTEYGHTEVIARSDSPWGPWENCPHNPILTHRSYHSPIQALGHADLVEAQDGSWWLVCLGFRPIFPQAHYLGRETFLAPVRWDNAGWPIVGQSGRINIIMESPHLSPVLWPAHAERDDFNDPALGFKWNFLGVPRPEDWSLARWPGSLWLQGNASSLDDGLGVMFVGCRQEHFNCEVATSLFFSPQTGGEEAGLTVWMDQRHHYDLFVSHVDGKNFINVRRRIGSLSATVAREELSNDQVTLLVRANRLFYSFAVKTDGVEHIITTGETRYLSSEVAGGFTGVYFALYASGNGQASSIPACFDWFDYRNLEQPGFLTLDSTLSDLLKDDIAKEIICRSLPDLVANPPAEWGANLSLLDLAAMSPDNIIPDMLILIDEELRRAQIVCHPV